MAAITLEKSPAQVLVVEDEAEIRELISLLLMRQGHTVQECATATEALEWIDKAKYDLVVLDWMMPGMSGLEFLRSARNKPLMKQSPILMVTAKSEPMDIVQGLDAGADDYMTKPFEPAVFAARVKALLRRAMVQEDPTESDSLTVGDLYIHLSTYEVRCGSETVHLTPSEFKILTAMMQNRGKVMTRDALVTIVQGEGISVTGRTVDTHVFGLRKKLNQCSEVIETIRGVGYRVRAE
jgi:two-component system phosphate regulon response regulator PhoB